MTQAQIRTAIRNITKEWETDEGTLFPDDNVLLDFYIEWACEDVVLDLVELMQEDFLDYEDISLAANTANKDLTKEWLAIWAMQKNVSGKNPVIIPYLGVRNRADREYVGETKEYPDGWYLKGTTIMWVPTPSTAKTNYARCWIVVPEATEMAESGPVYIPRMAHKLIVLEAAILIGYMNVQEVGNIVALYRLQHKRITDSPLTTRIQQQPQFVKGSISDKITRDRRDKAFYDDSGFFD